MTEQEEQCSYMQCLIPPLSMPALACCCFISFQAFTLFFLQGTQPSA